jgi:hypothetical protein
MHSFSRVAFPAVLAFCVLSALHFSNAEELPVWQSTSGRDSVQAEFVKLDGDNVTLRLPNGKEVTVVLEKLDEESQKLAKRLALQEKLKDSQPGNKRGETLEMPTSLPKFAILEMRSGLRPEIRLTIAQQSAIADSPVIQKFRRDIESYVPEGFRITSADIWTATEGFDTDDINRAAEAVLRTLADTEAVDRAVDEALDEDQRAILAELQRRLYMPLLMKPTELVLLQYSGVRKDLEINAAQSKSLDELWSRGNKLAPLPASLLRRKQKRRLNEIMLQCDLMNVDEWKRVRVDGKVRVFFERLRPALMLRYAAGIPSNLVDARNELAVLSAAQMPPSAFLWGQDLTILGPKSGSPNLFNARDATQFTTELQRACGKPIGVDWFNLEANPFTGSDNELK